MIIPAVGVGVVDLGASTTISFSFNDPVISTVSLYAYIRLDLDVCEDPFPCINAAAIDEVAL